jgi:sRNA-binding carbon storage regulator CsrA
MNMLVLSRKVGETVVIGGTIRVVVSIKGTPCGSAWRRPRT